jgi:type I restriction enzyme, S subunit
MTSEWPRLRIEQVAERVGMGPFGSSIKVETFVSHGVPIISGQHLHEMTLTERSFNFVTEEHAQKLKNSNVYRGDVIFTHAGTIGQVSVIPETSRYQRYVLSQRQFFLRCNRSQIDPLFVVCFFKSAEGRHKLLANASQVGVPSISKPVTYLRSIVLPVPPLSEQREIVELVGALNARIALLRETNVTLEAIAQALFKSWFVDFDPVRAKQQGLAPVGMDEATAALFPASFEESALGSVPKGWRGGTLAELMSIQGGTQPPASEFKDVPAGGYVRLLQIRDFSADNHITHVPATKRLRMVAEDDVLVGRYGSGSGDRHKDSLGRLLRGLDGAINVAIVQAIPAKSVYREWIAHYVGSGKFYESIVGGSARAVQAGFRQDDLSRIRVPIAPDLVFAAFDTLAQVVWNRTKSFRRQAETLAALRDTLLPGLISGRLRLPEAEAVLAEA